MPRPPRPRTSAARRRARWIAVCAVVPGLLLGFVAGVQLARMQRDGAPRSETQAPSAARAPGPEAQSRPGPEAPTAGRPTRPDPAALGMTEPADAEPTPSDPAIHRLGPDGFGPPDPEAWLARFGPVEVAPVASHP